MFDLDAERICGFLERIGLPVRFGEIAGKTFVPGVRIAAGGLMVDRDGQLYPGDLLHEAGHLAVMTPDARAACDGDAGPDGGAEMAAIGWSYAAALEIGLDPRVVFHEEGYRGAGDSLVENFEAGLYLGVPLLEWYGMTGNGVAYPAMRRWLR